MNRKNRNSGKYQYKLMVKVRKAYWKRMKPLIERTIAHIANCNKSLNF